MFYTLTHEAKEHQRKDKGGQKILEHTAHENPLGYEKISKLLFKFSLPSIVAMLVSSLYNIVDQIFIGQGLGYLGNGATTVAFPFTTIGLAIALLLGVGSAANYSLLLGQGKKEEAAKTVGASLTFMLVAGVLYLLIGEILMPVLLPAFGATAENYQYASDYSRIILIGMPFLILSNGLSQLARADGSPTFSMMSMIVGAVINCILDPLFIFVFHWGMAGAAWATIIGQMATMIVGACYLPRFKQIRLEKHHYRMHFYYLKRIASVGASASLNQVTILAVQIVLNNLFKHYGALSVYGANIPIAASGVAFKLNGLYVSAVVGLGQGAQPIIGFNYGARQYDRVKKTLLLAMVSIVVLGSLVEVLFQFWPVQLIQLFGNGDELYLQFGALMLRVNMACICIQGIQGLSANYFAAIGQAGKGAFLSMTRTIIFFMPLIFILPLFFGIEGMVFSQPIADFLSVIVSILFVRRSFKTMDAKAQADIAA